MSNLVDECLVQDDLTEYQSLLCNVVTKIWNRVRSLVGGLAQPSKARVCKDLRANSINESQGET